MPFALETDERSSFVPDRDDDDNDDSDSDSCSSNSSIGRNSVSSEDSSDREEDSADVEVNTNFKSPLETMNDLEQDLPAKRGISKFYSGKSKSFTSLADAATATCVQEIVKPEDPYAKKRKNLLARNMLINRSRSYADNVGGISKRPGRGTSCLTLSSLSSSAESEEGKNSSSISPPCPLPPHPHTKKSSANASAPCPQVRNSPWRSYSWSDLQSVAADAHDISGLAICSGNKGNKVH